MNDLVLNCLLAALFLAVIALIVAHIHTAGRRIDAILDKVTFDQQRELLALMWLYADWKYVTRNLTTAQKDLWADAIDEYHANQGLDTKVERWWRE